MNQSNSLTPQMVAELLLKVDDRLEGLEKAFDGNDVLTRLSDLEAKIETLQADVMRLRGTLLR